VVSEYKNFTLTLSSGYHIRGKNPYKGGKLFMLTLNPNLMMSPSRSKYCLSFTRRSGCEFRKVPFVDPGSEITI